MWNFNEIIELKNSGSSSFYIKFDNGKAGTVDLAYLIHRGPVFEALKDPEFFRQTAIVDGTIAWQNGVDISPATLYDQI